MSLEGDYIAARWKVLATSHRVIGHQFDPAEDPGWMGELDDETLDEVVLEMAAAINNRRQSEKRGGTAMPEHIDEPVEEETPAADTDAEETPAEEAPAEDEATE